MFSEAIAFFGGGSRQKITQDVADLEQRRYLVDAQIRQGIPLQVRAMRDARGWTQSVLAQKLGTTQNAISRLENPRTGKPTVTTLKRIAEVFDVALVVKFAPFSEFVDSISEMSEKSVSVPSYDTEAAEQKTGATNWTGAWPWQPITLSELNGAYAEEDWTSPMSAYALPFAGQSNIIDIDVARRLYNIDKYRKPMESIGINQDFYAKRA